MKTIIPSELPIPELHGYLLSAVAPRPIAFASTVDNEGRVNLSPFSFFNVFGANPPILIFSPARNGRTNTTKHTFDNVKETKECVINIMNYANVEQMSLASAVYDKGVNEFIKAGFTEMASELVKAPRVKEAKVQMECKVMQIIETGTGGGAGNLVICEIVRMHIAEDVLNEAGQIDGTKMDYVARMGANWYARIGRENMFEIAKPLMTSGIGIDALPEAIRNSSILSGNNLGRLGNVANKPSEEEILALQMNQDFLIAKNENKIHEFIKSQLENGNTALALQACFA